ncbi:hypothetical protein H8N03_06315 [Ramlibacter sp. USB13]|uniref:EF-hand domain-containing protein n=1 Tax=Ramlibacter cellulosilyticus TaxID=2764187 RepID=A0A923MPN1_9BURK|nr:EF-hand domain-containing protein [Ramlibacter cellulosilyticus]MBC5782551.1 hypothetical protein [Ramlibacter cellulosilyticus]
MSPLARLLATALCLAAATSAVHAQQRVSPSPSTSGAVARPAPATPNPAGLRPVFPAGVSSGSGAAVAADPIAANNSPVPAGAPGTMTPGTVVGGGGGVPTELFPSGTVPSTAVLGAGPVAGPSQYGGAAGAGTSFSAVDTARSFYFADANHDGELSRGEARRLSIATMSFEEMDRNFDGVISRFEYDDSLR